MSNWILRSAQNVKCEISGFCEIFGKIETLKRLSERSGFCNMFCLIREVFRLIRGVAQVSRKGSAYLRGSLRVGLTVREIRYFVKSRPFAFCTFHKIQLAENMYMPEYLITVLDMAWASYFHRTCLQISCYFLILSNIH